MKNTDQMNKDGLATLTLSYIEKVALSAYMYNSTLKIDAYKVAKGITNSDKTDEELNSRANSWLNNKDCKAFIRVNSTNVMNGKLAEALQNDNSLIIKPLDEMKNQLISELLLLKVGNKDTAELLNINKQLIDLQGLKKETTTLEESQVRYYLPLRCEICDYFNKCNPK